MISNNRKDAFTPLYVWKSLGIDIFDEVDKALFKTSIPVTKPYVFATDGTPSMAVIGSGFRGQFCGG